MSNKWQRWKGIMKSKEDLFWSKVYKKEDHECWPWIASVNRDGYGQFWIGDTFTPSHRFAWMITRRCEIPDNKLILHICDNSACCNPSHLYCGTQADNMRDRAERGPKVLAHILANPKLYEGEIWLIRRLKIIKSKRTYTRYKFPENFVAKMFKVDQSLIHLIWNSNKWLSREGTYV